MSNGTRLVIAMVVLAVVLGLVAKKFRLRPDVPTVPEATTMSSGSTPTTQ